MIRQRGVSAISLYTDLLISPPVGDPNHLPPQVFQAILPRDTSGTVLLLALPRCGAGVGGGVGWLLAIGIQQKPRGPETWEHLHVFSLRSRS